jgi:hypothetical protein
MSSAPYGRAGGITVHLKNCLVCGKLDVIHDAILVEQQNGALCVMYRSRAHTRKGKGGAARLSTLCDDGWSVYADTPVMGLAQDAPRTAPDEQIMQVVPPAREKVRGGS